jgi:acetyl esterase/lipase
MIRLSWCLLPAVLVCTSFLKELWVDSVDGVDIETGSDSSSLLQTKTQVVGTSNSSEAPEYIEDGAPVEDINARGTSTREGQSLSEEEYELSTSAADNGYTPENAYFDTTDLAVEEWSLFPPGEVPYERPDDAGPEVMQLNDPTDHCAPGDVSGYSILNVSKPVVLAYIVPKDQAGRRKAAVIVAPGGGSRFLSWNKEGTEIAKWLNSIGISAFVLKYRVPSNTPETDIKSTVDSQRAISMVRSKFEELGVEKIGFMGFSAGGAIVSKVSRTPHRVYKPIDDIDKVSIELDFALILYSAGNGDGIKNSPPTFVAAAKDDPCVPLAGVQAFYYTGLLQHLPGHANRYDHELHVFGGGRHGFGDCQLYVNGNSWLPLCAWTINAQMFIEKHIGIKRSLGVMTYPDAKAPKPKRAAP